MTRFEEALEKVQDEQQVLILMNFHLRGNAKAIATKLPKGTFTEHHEYKIDNDGADAWVEHHLNKQVEDASNDKKFKFLIGDWLSTAGYEVPAVIFVTWNLDNSNLATCVQRSKAKLIIYHNQELEYDSDLPYRSFVFFRCPSAPICFTCGQTFEASTFAHYHLFVSLAST